MSSLFEILTLYVCPSIGCCLSALMFLSPVQDLQRATRMGSLGHLPTLPWAFGLTNCLGWTIYGYLRQNFFIMLSNIPGLIILIFLNLGAIKLQYYGLWKDHTESTTAEKTSKSSTTKKTVTNTYDSINDDATVFSLLSTKSTDSYLTGSGLTDQERILYPLLLMWILFGVYVGWLAPKNEYTTAAVGVACNINLVFFYGVPVQILRKVIATRDCSPIHRPTLLMTTSNAAFWMMYGLQLGNPVIYAPNVLGSSLGFAQAMTLCLFPTKHTPTAKDVAHEAEAMLEAMVETLEEQIYVPLTPSISLRKRDNLDHPDEILVPESIRSVMLI